jgi:cellulose synthase operon protein C
LAVARIIYVAFKRAALAAFIAALAAPAVAYKPDSDAKAAYDRATEFQKASDYRAARVELMNATTKDPKWTKAFIAQSEVLLELFDTAAARAALEKAVALGAADQDVEHLFGHMYWLSGELEDAEASLTSEDIPAKHRPYADRILGRVYMDMGDTIAAEQTFNRALKSSPKDSKLWTEIARFRLVIANQGGAIEAVEYALKLDPNNIRALELRGRLVRTQFGMVAALPWFERALQVSPNDIPILEEYGSTLGEAGRYRDMLAQARKIISLDSDNPKAFYMQAVIAARAGENELARRVLGRIGGSFAEQPGPKLLSAIVEYRLGNWNLSADLFQKLVEQQPANLRLRTLLARAMHRAGDHRGAWDAIAPIVDRGDADGYTIMLGGRILEALAEPKPSAARLDRAAFPKISKTLPLPESRSLAGAADDARRNPRNANFVIPYVRLLLANNNIAAARLETNRLLEGNGGVAEAQLVAGDVEMAAGNGPAAITAYERARGVSFTSATMLRLVSAYRSAGKHDAAGKTISDFLNFNPDNFIAQRMWGFDLLDRKQWKEARFWLKKARSRVGYNDPVLNANIARAYAGEGDIDAALREARLSYRIHPANVMVTKIYGQVLLKSGKHPKSAYNLLRKANKLAPDDKETAKDYAAALKAMKKPKKR